MKWFVRDTWYRKSFRKIFIDKGGRDYVFVFIYIKKEIIFGKCVIKSGSAYHLPCKTKEYKSLLEHLI